MPQPNSSGEVDVCRKQSAVLQELDEKRSAKLWTAGMRILDPLVFIVR